MSTLDLSHPTSFTIHKQESDLAIVMEKMLNSLHGKDVEQPKI